MPSIGTAFVTRNNKWAQSIVLTLMCHVRRPSGLFATNEFMSECDQTLQLSGHRHNVYSMSETASGVLVAGGKSGLISFYDAASTPPGPSALVTPTLVAKAHGRWVSELQVIGPCDKGWFIV